MDKNKKEAANKANKNVKNFTISLLVVAVIVFAVWYLFTARIDQKDLVVKLPSPEKDKGVLITLEHRASAKAQDFAAGKSVSTENMATLLWAASGKNRNGLGFTTPFAKGKEPYVRVYVAGKHGVSLYNWAEGSVTEVLNDDIRKDIAKQDFVKASPQVLIFVIDAEKAEKYGEVAVGAMTQNIYLAAYELNVMTRYIAFINAEEISKKLKLSKNFVPIAVMPVAQK